MELKKGMKVRCKINETEIKNARLQYENGVWFVCQNVKCGTPCIDKLGYKYSWEFEQEPDGTYSFHVTDLEPADSTNVEDLYVGAIIKSKDGLYRRVLGICEEVVFLSHSVETGDNPYKVDDDKFREATLSNYTIWKLKEFGYTLVPETIEDKSKENMVEIDGEKFSKNIVKEAVKKYKEER